MSCSTIVNSSLSQPIMASQESGTRASVSQLIDVFEKGKTPSLVEAPQLEGRVQTVENPREPWLQTADQMINAAEKRCTPAQLYAFERLIREHRKDINSLTRLCPTIARPTAIFHELAKYSGPLEFVNVLVRNGADFGLQDYWGDTPLMWAIANAENGMAREILKNLPPSQTSSLNRQCFGDHNSALHLLIAKGYVSISAQGGILPCSNFELLKMAVDLGANVNLSDIRGNTPLHFAYARRDKKVIQLLLEHGADRNAVNRKGQKPIDLAALGNDESDNYSKAKGFLDQAVDGLFVLNENDFKNKNKLAEIVKL